MVQKITMKKMDKETEKKYFKDPNSCPFCSGILEGGSILDRDNKATREVVCTECEQTWIETFDLTEVMVTEKKEMKAKLEVWFMDDEVLEVLRTRYNVERKENLLYLTDKERRSSI